jgi:uncharacterized protein with NAD-binding domain and iron-sulfur cluster
MNGSDTVLVLGGGVGGLSAAHELAERGFSVEVVEDRAVLGGKARSIPVPGSGRDGREDLPAEHGFRFFPGFYRHLPDTMSRIPFDNQSNGVLGNLRTASEAEIAREGGKVPVLLPVRSPPSWSDLTHIVSDVTRTHLGLTAGDIAHFTERLLVLLTSCEERRFGEWEQQSWWEFSGATTRSLAYQRFLADGLTRSLVAAQAREMSARTGGYILLQLLFDMGVPGRATDRLLNGPTDDVWIDPWVEHLRALGVRFRVGTRVETLRSAGARITSVEVRGPDGGRESLSADWYVAAVPVEHMARLADADLRAADPMLDHLDRLRTRWMNGIVFFLHHDVPIVPGHVIYIDSPWCLTSISQRQFWSDNLDKYGAGDVGGILSVDVSDWTTPGPVTGKAAMDCSREEIFTEVWTQLQAHLNGRDPVLEDSNLISWFLDTDVRFPELHRQHQVRLDVNLEPLLVNTVGSWAWRPEAGTAIENLVLASDYVRTYTDLATMEGANEAARRATNAILSRSGSGQPLCAIWPLHEPAIFAPARWFDQWLYRHGLPNRLPRMSSSA